MASGGAIQCQSCRSARQRGIVFINCLPVIPGLQQSLTLRRNFENICQFLDQLSKLSGVGVKQSEESFDELGGRHLGVAICRNCVSKFLKLHSIVAEHGTCSLCDSIVTKCSCLILRCLWSGACRGWIETKIPDTIREVVGRCGTRGSNGCGLSGPWYRPGCKCFARSRCGGELSTKSPCRGRLRVLGFHLPLICELSPAQSLC